jgi:hypothetical protein
MPNLLKKLILKYIKSGLTTVLLIFFIIPDAHTDSKDSVIIDDFELTINANTYTSDINGNIYITGKNNSNQLVLIKYDKDMGFVKSKIIGEKFYDARKLLINRNEELMILCVKNEIENPNLCLYRYDLSLNCLHKFESNLKSSQKLTPITMRQDGNDDIIVLCRAEGLNQKPSFDFMGLIKFCCDNTNPMAMKFNTDSEQTSQNVNADDNCLMVNYDNSYSYVFKNIENKTFCVKSVSMIFNQDTIPTNGSLYDGYGYVRLLKTKYNQPYIIFNANTNQGSLLAQGKTSIFKENCNVIASLTDDSGYVYTINRFNDDAHNFYLRKDSVNYPGSLYPIWGIDGINTGFKPSMLAYSDSVMALANDTGEIKLFNLYSKKGDTISSNLLWNTDFKLNHLFGNNYGIYAIGFNTIKQTIIYRIFKK